MFFQYFPILLLSRYEYSIASRVNSAHKIIVVLCNGRLSNILLSVTHTNVFRIFCLAVGGVVAAQEDVVTIFHKKQQQELGPCENIFSRQLQTYSEKHGEEILCFFLWFWSHMYLICTYLWQVALS